MYNPWKSYYEDKQYFILVKTLAGRILLKALSKPEKGIRIVLFHLGHSLSS